MDHPRLAEADRLHLSGRHAEAIGGYEEVLAADPDCFEAWNGLGHAAASRQEYGQAIPALRRALKLRGEEATLRVNLGKALFALGHVTEAVREYARAWREGDEATRAAALRNLAVIAPGDPVLGNAAIREIRRYWAEAEAAAVTPLAPARRPGAKLRLAYYGAFFHEKNWMKMYMGVLNAHDRDRFELHLIADGAPPSVEAGYRDHPEDRIWEVGGLPNAELAGHIAEAGIDVLVDLNGYSHQARLPLLLHRAAPVQIAWNGMYGTTGFPGLDALIGDGWSIPPEEEQFCSEPVRRVAHTYLPFDFFYSTPPVTPPPCLEAGHVTFGSLNSAYKLTDPTIEAWSAVLRAVPSARLLMRNRALDHASNRADLLARFAIHGVPAERIALEGSGTHDEFLATYGRIDLALDSFPYNGGTTTAEALWQGVPVLTINGDRWAGRTSRSILMAAGLGRYVAPDIASFVETAVALTQDPQGLAERRAGQRAALAASPACDPASLCRELETIYLELATR
ncbi:O-linked N-acetylglucosamine transferase, SPINDLY family protein [Roseococcus pinisoli]|uniref:protein O-GlcNAc transferase n=1 Tax=Roseococcus pinisoli TaxID=2835040 RepID=A0ABS5QCV1_9PROT|nr:tetratricopeptide repeat protein [Roseococcus pinisoli]MBS7811506.1 tetratricopeptide repeat protein [Roseococcus pinisoli]